MRIQPAAAGSREAGLRALVGAESGLASVNGADWIILTFVAFMALVGYGEGLIVGLSSLVGFVGGALAGAKLAPTLLSDPGSPYASFVALAAAIFLGGITAATLEALGAELRRRIRGRLGLLDGIGGAVLLAALGLGLAWVFATGLARLDQGREVRAAVQRSFILSRLGEYLPRPSALLDALAKLDPLPRISAPPAGVAPPDPTVAADPDVARASGSVVRVLGTACGLGIEGSGWVARPGVVVTNAHVVAGETDTTVQVRGVGVRYPARAIWFDPRNDVAVLSVPALSSLPALPLAPAAPVGESAAVIGYPLNGPLAIGAARIGRTEAVLTRDIYGGGPVLRRVTAFRGVVRSGNSGGPLVDSAGRVLGTVFATARDSARPTGVAVPNDVVRQALARASTPVDTGPCAP